MGTVDVGRRGRRLAADEDRVRRLLCWLLGHDRQPDVADPWEEPDTCARCGSQGSRR
jgi:hypothetical protein